MAGTVAVDDLAAGAVAVAVGTAGMSVGDIDGGAVGVAAMDRVAVADGVAAGRSWSSPQAAANNRAVNAQRHPPNARLQLATGLPAIRVPPPPRRVHTADV
ncbi:MAG: hypothetical protein AB7P78_15595 [Candidatus Binatia bacterium]